MNKYDLSVLIEEGVKRLTNTKRASNRTDKEIADKSFSNFCETLENNLDKDTLEYVYEGIYLTVRLNRRGF